MQRIPSAQITASPQKIVRRRRQVARIGVRHVKGEGASVKSHTERAYPMRAVEPTPGAHVARSKLLEPREHRELAANSPPPRTGWRTPVAAAVDVLLDQRLGALVCQRDHLQVRGVARSSLGLRPCASKTGIF